MPPPKEVGQAPFPFFGLGWESFDFVPFWTWNLATPAAALTMSPTGVVPFSESAPLGGLQLDVQPWRAEVYVDGAYEGLVDDFRGYYHHLELTAGPHLIGIVAPDYRPLIIEVIVSPGQTTTYRGTLTRAESH